MTFTKTNYNILVRELYSNEGGTKFGASTSSIKYLVQKKGILWMLQMSFEQNLKKSKLYREENKK